MSKAAPLRNVFNADPNASVVEVKIPGLSLPPVKAAYLLENPDYPLVEGRGTYKETTSAGGARIVYTKGAGSAEAKCSATEEDLRTFTHFGHSSPRNFLFNSVPSRALDGVTGPRVLGALALPSAFSEIVNASVFLKVMMKKEGLSSIEDAEAKGLTIPQGVVFSPAISADICQGLSRVSASIPGISPKEGFNFKYGLASLRVPASHRLRTKGKIPESVGDFWFRVLPCPEKMGMVGRVLKHQLACGFVSNSTHFQNIYDAPHSICPHADSADLIPISEILREAEARKLDRDEILESLVLGQLCYMPFNLLLKYKGYPPMQRVARAAIHTILSTVAPEAFNFVEREVLLADFTRKPYSVLSSIAKRLIQEKMVLTDPQIDWQKMRDDHADIGYDGVAVQMVELALDDAIRYTADVQKAERSLNRQRD